MWGKTEIALIYQSAYSSGVKAEPTPWGLLAFIGLGIIIYILILFWWTLRPSYSTKPPEKGLSMKGCINHMAGPIFCFAFFIAIVTIRKLFEMALGDTAANTIGIISELIGIAWLALIMSKNKS